MLSKESLKKNMNGAISWIRDYVKNTNAKGVVIRK